MLGSVEALHLIYFSMRMKRVFDCMDALLYATNNQTVPLINEAARKQALTVDDGSSKLFNKANRILDDVDGIADFFRTQVLPNLVNSSENIQAATGQLPAMLDNVDRGVVEEFTKVHSLTDSATVLVTHMDGGIVETTSQLSVVMDRAAKRTDRVYVLADDPAWKQLLASGSDIVVQANRIMKNLNSVTSYWEGKLVPKPRTYSSNPVMRTFQKIGHYSWEVVKTAPGTAILILKTIELAR